MGGVTTLRHGHSRRGQLSPTYESWLAMRSRCYRRSNISFGRYGGRGIAVCAGWRESFDAFLRDMGPRPAGTTLDRVRPADGYWCGACIECRTLGRVANCRWATQDQQSNNKRTSHRITAHGETLTVAQWEKRLGMSCGAVGHRILNGWSELEAVTVPKGGSR